MSFVGSNSRRVGHDCQEPGLDRRQVGRHVRNNVGEKPRTAGVCGLVGQIFERYPFAENLVLLMVASLWFG
jgi:hypothetical protein